MFPVSRIDFSLRDSVGDTISSFSLRAQQSGLELLCVVAPDVPDALIGDPARLRQILVNLIGNSLKFTSRGEITVRVDLEEDLGDEIIARFSVIDTGIGIPPDKRDLIFESFSQADGSTTREYGGTGLGLSIARKLAQAHGGDLEAANHPQGGAVFTLTLPV